jgi:hypothetical protein
VDYVSGQKEGATTVARVSVPENTLATVVAWSPGPASGLKTGGSDALAAVFHACVWAIAKGHHNAKITKTILTTAQRFLG